MRSKEDLLNYGGPDRIVPAMEMAIKFQNEPEFLISLRSGIHTLDKLTDGFRDGELITISGYTKNGKTLLAQTLTAAFMEQGSFPLWFSYLGSNECCLGDHRWADTIKTEHGYQCTVCGATEKTERGIS